MVHGAWCGAKVFPTDCWHCRQPIFIFICNCDCRVLFDDLGAPWPKHLCAQGLVKHYGFTEQQVNSLVRRRADELGLDVPEIDHLFGKALVEKRNWKIPIQRVTPSGTRRIIGVIRDRVFDLDPRRKLGVTSGTVKDRQLSRQIPGRVAQLTVHSGAIGAAVTESFTFWLTSPVSKTEFLVGRLIEAELETMLLPGFDPIWLARRTKLYENSRERRPIVAPATDLQTHF